MIYRLLLTWVIVYVKNLYVESESHLPGTPSASPYRLRMSSTCISSKYFWRQNVTSPYMNFMNIQPLGHSIYGPYHAEGSHRKALNANDRKSA